MAVTGSELRESLATPMSEALERVKITCESLAKQLKSELRAKIPEVVKFDGQIRDGDSLPPGWQLVKASKGKSILEVTRVDFGTRQRARMDAHKLLGHYPAEKADHRHTGSIEVEIRDCVREAADAKG
jgi:hypothetical protein